MEKLAVLFASIALLLVAVAAMSGVTQDSRRSKGGREWRGKPQSTVLNLDVHQQSEETDKNIVKRTQEQLKAGKGGLRQHTALKRRLPSHSATEYESQSTTNLISSTVEKFDGAKMLTSIEPLRQMYVSTEGDPILASDVDEEHLETSIMQSEFTPSPPMVEVDINQSQKSKNPITETSNTFKTEIKPDKTTLDIISVEHGNDDIGENNPMMSSSGENSNEDSVERVIETRLGKSQSKENNIQPSIERNNSESQRQNHASRMAKPSSRNVDNTKTNPHSRPFPVAAVNLNLTPKPQQSVSKQTPAPSLSHGNRRMLPPLGLHPKSPWIVKNPAQVSSTPIPGNSLNQRKKLHVPATAALVPLHGARVQQSKSREYVSATSVPVHSNSDQQKMNMVQATATSILADGSHVQQRKNIVQVRATSVPVHSSNVQPRKNRVRVSATSIPEKVQQVLTLQSDVPPGGETADSDENVDSREVTEKRIIPPISPKTPQQIVSNDKQTETKTRVTKLNEMSKNGHNISKAPSTVSSSGNGRLAKVQNGNEKNAPGEKNVRKASPKKRTESGNVDVKPQASSDQLNSRHSGASNAVAITSIALISFVTFLTITGVYFKKISFSRKRYSQHILLNTEEDDLPLFNRQTNYDNYESPYKSWQDL